MKKIMFLMVLLVGTSQLIAQHFVPAFDGFSRKKTSYLHMEDTKVKKGTLRSYKIKKGLIEEIKFRDMNDKKVKIKPEKISHMYLPPSGLAKLDKMGDFLSDANQWEKTELDQDILGKGYAFFEKTDVKVKRKTRTLMMQLMNPSFAANIKVYYDPLAGETMSAGIGGVKLVGGLAKSYYVKKTDEKVAFRLKKKNYDEEFKSYFGDCKALMKKYGKDPRWSDFEKHVYEYSKECGSNK